MSPFERTVYCLSEAHIPQDQAFEDLFQRTTAVVEEQPETADWSEVVCLALSDEASVEHMQMTINTLQLILAVQQRKSHPARGFKKILEQRLTLYEQIDDGLLNLSNEQQERDLLALDYEAEIKELMQEVSNQRKKIESLDQQVQKLKEVELMLTPKK
jgi:cell division protein FtsL